MKKILITGASGFLGWNLCQVAAKEWEVYGTYCSHPLEITGINLLPVDLRNFQELKGAFQDIQPDAVIHTAAQSQPNFCQTHPQESREINVTASWNIAGLCADAAIPCAFTSSDLVFDGQNAPYQESDPVCPINIYGEQKVMAELGMLDRHPQTAVCRMPLMFGDAGTVAKSFLQPMLQNLREGKEIRLFVDQYRNPISGTTAASGLLLALEKDYRGILHLGGRERVSRYEFFQILLEVIPLPGAKLVPCRQQDMKMPAPRPLDVCMDISQAIALGYNPRSLREQIEELRLS